ncbi:MAG: hypothetical protein V1733_03115 [bacterium]
MEEKQKKPQMEYSGKFRELFYEYNSDGTYDKEVRLHDDSDKLFINQAWEVFDERTEEARQKVYAGKVSPIVYYMERDLMDPLGLAMQAGISLWRVKRHLKPGVFKRLNDETLQKYANVFSISVDQLKKIE